MAHSQAQIIRPIKNINLSHDGVQSIVVDGSEQYAFNSNAVSLQSSGNDLYIYQDGQLKAVLQNYNSYFNHLPILDSTGAYTTLSPTVDATTSAIEHAVAEQISATMSTSSIPTATTTVATTAGGGIPTALLVAGGAIALGGAAALAAGGGSGGSNGNATASPSNTANNDDSNGSATTSPNNTTNSNNSNESTTSNSDDTSKNNTTIDPNADIASEHTETNIASASTNDNTETIPYFIQSLNTETNNTLGFLSDTNKWSGIGQPINITYSFANSRFDYDKNELLTGWRAFTDTQKADIREAFSQYTKYTNITFTETTSNVTADFVIYLDDLGRPVDNTNIYVVEGYAYHGGGLHLNSSIYFADDAFNVNHSYTRLSEQGGGYGFYYYSSGYSVFIHELGHVLGLTHPFLDDGDDPNTKVVLNEKEDSDATTIMSYVNYDTKPIKFSEGNREYEGTIDASQNELKAFDIATLTYRYGVNEHYHSGNDTYHFSQFNPSIADGNIIVVDGNGTDTIDATNQTENTTINLVAGSWNYVGSQSATLAYDNDGNPTTGQLFISFNSIIENAKGGTGNDTLTGNSADNYLYGFSGNDTINGADGNDQLEGGQGTDILTGGNGADAFIFASKFDGTHDQITDFSISDGDKIWLNKTIFTALANGISEDNIVNGSTAKDSDDYLIYNSTNHTLYYDADGSGTGSAIAIATLDNFNEQLTANQFIIV